MMNNKDLYKEDHTTNKHIFALFNPRAVDIKLFEKSGSFVTRFLI